MPPPPRPSPPAHSVHAMVHGTADGVNWANVFWVRNGGLALPSSSVLNQFAKAVADAWSARFRANINGHVELKGCEVLYYGNTGIDGAGSDVRSQLGTLTADPLPTNCATCISWKVQQHYRGGHPRTYLPPPDITKLASSNKYSAAFATAIAGAANAFLQDVNGFSQLDFTDVHLGTVSFVRNKEWRTPPVFRDYTPTAASCDTRIDSQRRRLGPDI